MRIEQAGLRDAPRVMELITLCTEHMRADGIDQWDDVYPNLQIVEDDARAGALFVAREDVTCVASVCLSDVQPEEFRPLPWRYEGVPILVIHRLCVHPEWQRRGVARGLMDFAENYAAQHDFASIRLDAYTGNPRALALYERRGYRRVGQNVLPTTDPTL
jgi:ribosomal protein S18 acetylase RimI-like enzyme